MNKKYAKFSYLFFVCILCSDVLSVKDPNLVTTQMINDPNDQIVVWIFNPVKDSNDSLNTALSSKLINHVIIHLGGRVTENFESGQYRKKIQVAIELAKKHNCKTIFFRYFWPTYNKPSFSSELLFDSHYYVYEINSLKEKAKEYKVDYIGFDLEAYKKSPVGKYLRWENNYVLNKTERERLSGVVDQAIKVSGKVDFVYPAGSVRKYHAYNILSKLANFKIAERTYYDNEIYLNFEYKYDIFGIYLNTDSHNQRNLRKKYYTVDSLLNHMDRWKDKKGIFLFRYPGKAQEIAKQLCQKSEIFQKKIQVK